MLALLAAIPIIIVGVLMIGFMWPAMKAMPLGWIAAVIIGVIWWDMPLNWIMGASIGGVIDAFGILLIVFGALLILQLLKESGGVDSISYSMATVSTDRRVQALLLAFLMGAFFEGAAGFGTPAAVAAPLLVALGHPPLIAATIALIGNSVPVSFGAVGVPIWGGFDVVDGLVELPLESMGAQIETFRAFLESVGGYAAILNGSMAIFIPLAIVGVMTKIAEGSLLKGLKVWPLAIFSGLIFGLPMIFIANFIGPELPSLLGSLIALPIFVFAVRRGFLVPGDEWDYPDKENWEDEWEDEVEAEAEIPDPDELTVTVTPFKAWLPYLIIAAVLVITRIEAFGLVGTLQGVEIGWENILGTDVSEAVAPLYNPGIIPFILVALFIPYLLGMEKGKASKCWMETLSTVKPAAIALFFAVAMVYVMMNSDPVVEYTMLEEMAFATANIFGGAWHFGAPFVGTLGAFISGSNTVSNIMFGAFQFETAMAAGVEVIPTLGLQTAGAAGGNMLCVHNVVAAITTVGLVGKAGLVMRKTILVTILYGLFIALLTTFLVGTLYAGIF
ncbi:L-lactate permease [Halarsenatibacter silvermanii]|uniref:L-lactate permease n=1 Tax=Halarsenatibacter silvermanii TaxID=321763 RepID=A0A1G9JWN6_9FIRM|nr:L-lactate permease [Halarsenatibacter silvermanii]SDL41987.1 lactate permease [Halarsenatibacter silvermanii]